MPCTIRSGGELRNSFATGWVPVLACASLSLLCSYPGKTGKMKYGVLLSEVASGVQSEAICHRDEEVGVMVRASVWMSP
jgi:hypothetical protein